MAAYMGGALMVFPAHAGMSLILAGLANKNNGFPRSRGDEPL